MLTLRVLGVDADYPAGHFRVIGAEPRADDDWLLAARLAFM